jgi:hypothetical protein
VSQTTRFESDFASIFGLAVRPATNTGEVVKDPVHPDLPDPADIRRAIQREADAAAKAALDKLRQAQDMGLLGAVIAVLVMLLAQPAFAADVTALPGGWRSLLALAVAGVTLIILWVVFLVLGPVQTDPASSAAKKRSAA